MTLRPFEQVVAEYGPMVLRVCRAVVGPVDAEDAWSETFLAALRAYPGLPGDADVEAWLVTIAHRKAVDAARADSRRPIAVPEVPEPGPRALAEGPAAGSGSDGDLWNGQLWDGELWQALKALPQRQRAAVAYHHLAGLPYKEIAAITGGTADAARRAAADGIKSLRSSLGTHAEEKGEKR
ncbi:RNA polymerase sigma factor [Streptomyces marispadix]|uniref:RNA polymerase sigma factor n=1 Tax=Streptomyces marispadix TaxID=2922868 RepID=A0ABS9T572_9ACTN|nr:RNA polymerase sigma factor [Streptomyces marispadix]MCH6163711.1 RNA polymerase sigma factor [Streptomyces marispadix]